MKRTATLLALAALVPVAALPATADAKKRGSVRVSKACAGGGIAKLKASPENGKIEIEFEVDVNRNGQRWDVVITRNGARVYAKTKTTRAPSGSFTSRKVISNAAGADRIHARATGPNGRSCTVSLSY